MQTSAPRQVDIPRHIRLFFLLSGALWAVCIGTEWVCHYFLHFRGEIYQQPLFIGLRFYDLLCYRYPIPYLHTERFFSRNFPWPYTYPAAMAPLYAFFFFFKHTVRAFYFTFSLCVLVTAGLFARALHARGLRLGHALWITFLTIVLSYPLLFVIERANLEMYLFFPIAAGGWAIVRNKPYAAAVFWGVAAAMKLYPILFLAILLSRKQYRALALGLATAVGVSVLALWWVGPTISFAYHASQAGQTFFRTEFLLKARPTEFGYDHSLFGLWRRFANLPSPDRVARILTGYMAVTAVTGTLLYFLRIRLLPLLNQITLMVIACILLTPVSFDYTLVHLYLPVALVFLYVVDLARAGKPLNLPGLTPVVVCLALLCAAESELILHGVRLGSAFKCIVLVVLFGLALAFPLGPAIDDRRVPAI